MLICLSSLKLGAFLILSNRRCRSKNMLKDPFIACVMLCFQDNNTLVKGMIDVMSISYDILPPESKQLIHEKYITLMANRLNRV